jgi:hypothetical protein
MGRSFEMRTNYNGLKYFFDQPTLNLRWSRWLEFLCEYEFDIKHISMICMNKRVHELHATTRRVHELHATTISMYQTDFK